MLGAALAIASVGFAPIAPVLKAILWVLGGGLFFLHDVVFS